MTAPHLTTVIENNLIDERQRALRALLSSPMLLHNHPAYLLVRKHGEYLKDWFRRETGWILSVEDDFARLGKQAYGSKSDSRPARLSKPPGAPPFNRSRYALFCLALSELERGANQITLGRLGESVRNSAGDPELEKLGFDFELNSRDERRDIVAVARLLLELGILTRVVGDEEAFIHSRERDVLYDVNRRRLSSLLMVRRGPSLVEKSFAGQKGLEKRVEAVTETFISDSAEARRTEIRQRLTARLLDNPLIYWEELTEEETAYMASQRPHIARRIREATGLIEEVRAEGIAMVDPRGELTDERLPHEGTEGHATLLLAGFLGSSRQPCPIETLHRQMAEWIKQYGPHWKKSVRQAGGEIELCDQALKRLLALRLVSREEGMIVPLPAIGRHALGDPVILEPKKGKS